MELVSRETGLFRSKDCTGDGMPTIDIFGTANEYIALKVGLPARGKSYLSNKLMRYLQASQILFTTIGSH